MSDIQELQTQYENKLRRKSKVTTILYYTLQIVCFVTAVTSLIMFFIRKKGLEQTAMQIFMCIVAVLFMNIPVFFQKRFKWYIPSYIAITLYLFIFAHFVLGEAFRLYDYSKAFDKILHTTSGVIMSFIGFSFIYMFNKVNPQKLKLSPFFIVLFTFCFTMTTEYVWELLEYGIDRIFDTNMQRWQDGIVEYLENDYVISRIPYGSGLKDAMMDMLVNIFGCLGVCIYIYIGMKLKPELFDSQFILTNRQIKQVAAAKAEKEYDRLCKEAEEAESAENADAVEAMEEAAITADEPEKAESPDEIKDTDGSDANE